MAISKIHISKIPKEKAREITSRYKSTLGLYGKHLTKQQRRDLLEKLFARTSIWNKPHSEYARETDEISLTSTEDSRDINGTNKGAAHEAVHYLDAHEVLRYSDRLKYDPWAIKEEHLSTATTVFNDYERLLRNREFNTLNELIENWQRIRQKLIDKKTDMDSSYAEGIRLGLKAIKLSRINFRIGKWFLFLISRGYPEVKAEILARSFARK